MLSKHGVHIRREELRDLFTLIGKRPTTELSLEQFKELCFSRQANLRFHELVGLARKERADENAKTYIPFSFNSLLEHLCRRARREKLHQAIQESSQSNYKKDVKNFVQLFKQGMENIEGTSDRHVQVLVKTALRMKKLNFKRGNFTMVGHRAKQKR